MADQMPNHVGLYHRMRRITEAKNEAAKVLRNAGYGGGKKNGNKKKKKK